MLLEGKYHEGENLIIVESNDRVGNEYKRVVRIMWAWKEITENYNEDRIPQLCVENNLIITNTKLRHKKIQMYKGVEYNRK